jgi:hypothetical protein
VTRATITNKTTGVKLEGEYTREPASKYFEFAIDGTGWENTMLYADWDIDEQKPLKYADAIEFIQAGHGSTAEVWSEQLKTGKYEDGWQMGVGTLSYIRGWLTAYRTIIAELKEEK